MATAHVIVRGTLKPDGSLELESPPQQKIYSVLKEGYFRDADDAVDISDGPEDSIHLVIFSRKFTGRSMQAKHDLIWAELMQNLEIEEWNKISLSIGASPEEIKAT